MIRIQRDTRETDVRVGLELGEGEGSARVQTPVPFLTHMLETLVRYAGLELEVEASGDLEHHLIEDVAITLGLALRDAVPSTCARFGEATVPMDDALVQATLDAGGRHYYEGPVPEPIWDHFFRSLSDAARWTLHLQVIRGTDPHHVNEAAFKALGLALRQARRESGAVFSTKGSVRIRRADAEAGEPVSSRNQEPEDPGMEER